MKTVSHNGKFEEIISYPLKKKNYDDLILTDVLTPRILVLVTIPDDIELWLAVSKEKLLLQRSAYWISLAGLPSSPNDTTVTVAVPIAQPFNVEQLCTMMYRIDQGGEL